MAEEDPLKEALGIELPPRLVGRWYDVGDILSRDDDLLQAILKVMIYNARLVEANHEVTRAISQVSGLPIEAKSFEEINTEEAVTVAPGDREEILRWDVHPSAIWWEVGTTDEDYTSYEWIVDNDDLFEEPLRQPLGIYNSPYRFPNPLLVDSSVRVIVSRDSDAPASADYVSKLRGIPIPEVLYNELKAIVEV